MNLHVLNMADGLLGVKSINDLFCSWMQRKFKVLLGPILQGNLHQ